MTTAEAVVSNMQIFYVPWGYWPIRAPVECQNESVHVTEDILCTMGILANQSPVECQNVSVHVTETRLTSNAAYLHVLPKEIKYNKMYN